MIKRLFDCPGCDNRMTYTQAVLGCCYMPVHFVLMPLLAAVYMYCVPGGLSDTQLNVLIMSVSLAFVLIVMGEWLRRNFYVLLDGPGRCALCLAIAFALNYAATFVINITFMLVQGGLENPNNDAIAEFAGRDYGMMLAITVFWAPVVEETLFRGAVFGTIRTKSRVAAYIVSILLFSLAHVWQYALAYSDPLYLVYMLQYVPVSFVLAWMYERSGSIWTPIIFHILQNSLSFYLLTHF